jgi:hypothetical protein
MKVEVCSGQNVMELLSIMVLSVAFIHLINRAFPPPLFFSSDGLQLPPKAEQTIGLNMRPVYSLTGRCCTCIYYGNPDSCLCLFTVFNLSYLSVSPFLPPISALRSSFLSAFRY